MTCIVGITDNKKVYLGGDSFSGSSYEANINNSKKVIKINGIVLGSTGTWRGQQILEAYGIPSILKSDTPEKYIVKKLVPCLRKLFKDHGHIKTDNGSDEQPDTYLVGINGRLFTLQGDFSFTENMCKFDAIGAGQQYALGALYAVTPSKLDPKQKLIVALKTAEQFSPFVRSPFCFVEGAMKCL